MVRTGKNHKTKIYFGTILFCVCLVAAIFICEKILGRSGLHRAPVPAAAAVDSVIKDLKREHQKQPRHIDVTLYQHYSSVGHTKRSYRKTVHNNTERRFKCYILRS